jgi:hypothetical protein
LIYFQESFATIEWDEENHWILNTFYGFSNDEQGKINSQKVLELIKLKKARKLIYDHTEALAISKEFQKELIHKFYVEAMQAGLKYRAVVRAKSALYRLITSNINEELTKMGLEFATFDNLEEAKNWMRLKP